MNRAAEVLKTLPYAGGIILHSPENIRYLSGFTGEGVLVLTRENRVVITDFRYEEQLARQSPGWQCVLTDASHSFAERIAEWSQGITQLFCEMDVLTVEQFEGIKAELPSVTYKPLDDRLVTMRVVKDEEEIAYIREAARITDLAFERVLGLVKPGVTERELALEVLIGHIRFGASGASFSTIVASGPNSSMPHAIPSERKLQAGDLITFDIGCTVNGYASDFTRTVALGKVDAELLKIYDIVLEANQRGHDALRDEQTGFEVDKAARDVISAAGYGRFFGHSTGHGVGLQIHEAPRLSTKGMNVLKPGMVVTIEPGIYLPGKGGVRIEDLCLVTKGGHETYTKATKELIVL